MLFPNTSNGRPFARLDGRTGQFKLSTPDGGEMIAVDMIGKMLDLDLRGATQGWLHVHAQGADWQQLAERDRWGVAPSDEHSPGVEIDLRCDAWPEPQVRQMRGNSRAVTGFVSRVAQQAGDVPGDKAVRLRITDARVVKVGKGTSVDLRFEIAPRDRWPDRAIFDDGSAEPAAAPAPTVSPGGAMAPAAADDWD